MKERARTDEPWVLAATTLATCMAFIDLSAVAVALPALQRDFGATAVQMQWILEAQALFLTALLLAGGSLADRLGRRRMLLLGVAGFGAASVVCALARSVELLLLGRALQGVAAALLLPASLAVLSASAGEERRGKVLGTWVAFVSIASTLGSVLAFQIIDHASWRGVFLLQIPIALAALPLIVRFVAESRSEASARSLDLPGAVLTVLALGGITFGLLESTPLGWSDPRIVGALILGAAALAAFVRVEARVESPMMPLSLFRSRAFTGAGLLRLCLEAALRAALFLLPFYLIQVHGASATTAGTALLPVPILMFLLSRWCGSLTDRFGARPLLILGSLLSAAGYALLAMAGDQGDGVWAEVLPASLALGLGLTLTGAPLTRVFLDAVEEHHAGIAAGVMNTLSRAGGLLGVAALGVVMLGLFGRGLEQRLKNLDLPPAARQAVAAQRQKLGALEVPATLPAPAQERVRTAVRESFREGYRGVMLAAAGLCLVSALGAWRLISPSPLVPHDPDLLHGAVEKRSCLPTTPRRS